MRFELKLLLLRLVGLSSGAGVGLDEFASGFFILRFALLFTIGIDRLKPPSELSVDLFGGVV